jgi:hypothetical protein
MSEFTTMAGETLASEIQRCRKLVEMNPDDYPPNNRAAWAISVRQAKDSLADLRKEYVNRLQNQSITVILTGPPEAQRAFSMLAGEKGVKLRADVESLYEKLAQRVLPSLGAHREWGTTQHGLTIQYALNEAVDLGFQEMQHNTGLPFTAEVLGSARDAYEIVQETITGRLGYDLPRAYARKQLIDIAEREGLAPGGDRPFGVVITGAQTAEEAAALLQAWPTAASEVVTLEDVPTKDFVVQTFRRLQKDVGQDMGQEDEEQTQPDPDQGDDESSAVTAEQPLTTEASKSRKNPKKHPKQA